MIPDDGITVQPSDSSEMIDDDVEKEKTIKKKTTSFNTPNTTPPSNENITASEGNKNEVKTPEINIIVLKDPEFQLRQATQWYNELLQQRRWRSL